MIDTQPNSLEYINEQLAGAYIRLAVALGESVGENIAITQVPFEIIRTLNDAQSNEEILAIWNDYLIQNMQIGKQKEIANIVH